MDITLGPEELISDGGIIYFKEPVLFTGCFDTLKVTFYLVDTSIGSHTTSHMLYLYDSNNNLLYSRGCGGSSNARVSQTSSGGGVNLGYYYSEIADVLKTTESVYVSVYMKAATRTGSLISLSPELMEKVTIHTDELWKFTNDGIKPFGYADDYVGAFTNCSTLNTITIPNTVTSLGKYAFNSSTLSQVTLPTNCTYYDTTFPKGCIITGGKLINNFT